MAAKPIPTDGKTTRRTILKPDEKRKVTLVLSVRTDALLSAYARMRKSDRSVEAERMILTGLAKMGITWDGKDYGSPAPSDGEAA